MDNLQNLIQFARERKAQEILIAAEKPVFFRIGRDLFPSQVNELNAVQSRNLVMQILTDDEKKSLYQELRIQGMKSLQGVQFKFDFQIDFNGVTGSLQFDQGKANHWNLPPNLSESLMRTQGLHLICGPRRSGKSSAIVDLLQQAKLKNRSIACFVDDEIESLNLNIPNLSQYPIVQLAANAVPRSADIICIDTKSIQYFERALQLAEEGYSVILTAPFWNIQMSLERFLDLIPGSPESSLRRLSSVLQWVVGCQLLPGIEAPFVGAFEMLTMNKEVQKAFKFGKLDMLKEIMSDRNEKLGMRTLNQSLFQLVIKRKVELKTAFEFSDSAEELDQILKKIGI